MMKILHRLLIFSLFLCSAVMSGQGAGGPSCEAAVPFCTANLNQPFDNCFNGSPDPNCTTAGQPGIDYGCLGSEPFPTWYFLQIDDPGDLEFTIFQNTNIPGLNPDGSPILAGGGLDVDFAVWGPFPDTNVCGMLGAPIDCSFSAAPIEDVSIPNAMTGEVYIFLITNFNRAQGQIFVQQTNAMAADAGTTDCSIVFLPVPPVLNDVDICDDGTPVILDTTDPQAVAYEWSVFNDVTMMFDVLVGETNPTLTVTASGTYQVIITDAMGNMSDPVDAIVNFFETPVAVAPPAQILCDGINDDGFAIFDLDSLIPTILNGLDPTEFLVTFHTSQADADGNVGTLGGTAAFNSQDDIIFARVENNGLTDCFDTVEFELDVIDLPEITVPPNFTTCDNVLDGDDTNGRADFDLSTQDVIILNGQDPAQFAVTYHPTLFDAQSNTNAFPAAFQNTVVNIQEIFIRVENTAFTDCFSTDSFFVEVVPLPILINTPVLLSQCDDDIDGFAFFTLSSQDALITGGDASLTVEYYLTETQANEAPVGLALDNMMYINNDPFTQTVWARVFNATGCFDVVPLELVVLNTPMPNTTPDAFEVCDDNADGVAIFDLTSQEAQILDGLDPMVFTVTWFIDQTTADAGTPAIANPMAYTSNTNTVVAVVTYVVQSATTFCTTSVALDLIVNPLPIPVQPAAFELCDDIESGSDIDEFSIFDLRSRDDEITGGNDDWTVSYHLTEAEAEAGTPTLADMYQNVTMADQTIWVRVEDVVTGCFDLITLTLVVNPLPSPAMIPAVEECDDDGDGIALFDLTTVLAEIQDTENVTITVFDDLAFAEVDPLDPTNAILDMTSFSNTTPGSQTLFARVDSNIPGNFCFVIVPFDVIVNPLPEIDPAFDGTFTFCGDFDGNDTVGTLDFATLADELGILAPPQVTADFTITYHDTQAAADAGFPALPSPYEVSDGEQLFIRVENTATGCVNFTDVTVTVESNPLSMDPDDLILCADNLGINVFPEQDTATFNLNNQDAAITGGAAGISVIYYTSLEDAQNMVNAIPNPSTFVNTSNPQTIWAAAENDASLCMSEIVEFDLIVEPLPFTDLTDEGNEICVDEITGEELEPFTVDGTVETPLPDTTYDYEWTLNGSLLALDPIVTINQAGTYQLTITATYDDGMGAITSCTYTAEVVFTAVSAPVFEATVVEDSFNTGGLYTVVVTVVSSMGDFNDSDFEFALDDGPFQTSMTFTNVTPGTHTIFGRRIGADCNISEVEISIIDFPRFFTPNSDGFHDTWNIIGIGVDPNLNAQIFIFDRFGKLLIPLSPTSPGWDGTFNGQPMPSNDYWFRVEFTEPDEIGTQRTFTGHFTLKR